MRTSMLTGSLLFSVLALLLAPGLGLAPLSSLAAPTVAPASAAGAALALASPASLSAARDLLRRGLPDDALAAALAADPPPERRADRDLLAGLLLSRAGRWDEARDVLERVGKERPRGWPLTGRWALALAEAREAMNDVPGATDAWTEAARRERGPVRDAALVRLGQSLALEGRDAEAEVALEPLVARLGLAAAAADPAAPPVRPALGAVPAPKAADVLALLESIARRAGDDRIASACRRQLFYRHPCTQAGREAASCSEMAGERVTALAEGRARDLISRVEAMLDAGCAREAGDEAALLLDAGLAGDEGARARLAFGRALRASGRPADALVQLAAVETSSGALSSRAALESAAALRSLKRSAEARRELQRAAGGPRSPWRDEACTRLAQAAVDEGREADARESWRRVAEGGTTAPVRIAAAWKLGWSQYRSGLMAGALVTFDDLAAKAPTAREGAAARYWAARIVRRRGDDARALARLTELAHDSPHDYYGVVAAEEAGVQIDESARCAPGGLEAELAARLEKLGEAGVVVASLASLGLIDEALQEIPDESGGAGAGAAPSEASCPSPDAATSRVLLLALAGRHLDALRTFRAAAPDWRCRTDLPAAAWCAAYPLDHAALVMPACVAQGLDPALVLALIHQESVFEPQAVSWAGAHGLMQIMPPTGRTIAHWLGESVTTQDLDDPARNIRYGTVYLRRLLDQTGRVELALAGYNAGGGRVSRWWKDAGGQDVPFFVESIPLDETRDYVKAIRVGQRVYRGAWLTPAMAAALPDAVAPVAVAGARP